MDDSKLTEKDWLVKGMRLFGEELTKWRFKCPACGNIQSAEDFRQFKDQGSDPNDAYQQCIGRYTGGRKGPHKCDWAAFGFFRGPNLVVSPDGKEIPVFPFDEPKTQQMEAK